MAHFRSRSRIYFFSDVAEPNASVAAAWQRWFAALRFIHRVR